MKNKKILLIMEGVDGVGKTSALEKIANGEPIYHETGQTSYNKKDMIKRYDEYQYFDRSFIGELIWSDVYNRKPKLTFDEAKEFYNYLTKKYNVKVLLKMRPGVEIRETIKKRGEKLNYNYMDVYGKFVRLMENLKINFEVITGWI